MRPQEQLRAEIAIETAALLEYRAMPETKIFLRLLDALAEDQYNELASVKPDRLLYRQGALAQLNALRAVLRTGDANRSARV